MRAVPANPGIGVGRLRSAMTNCSRSTRRPSPTMQQNSGLLQVPIQTRRSGWQK
jgi:hypothetical protein